MRLRTVVMLSALALAAGCSSGPAASVTQITAVTPDWNNVEVPGEFCSVPGNVMLRDSEAITTSTQWGRVHLATDGHPLLGHLVGKGTTQVALDVWCDNGGGTADGQLAEEYVIFDRDQGEARVLGYITPQEQPPNGDHVTIFADITMTTGTITAHEQWYEPDDDTCCPSGTATTIWKYRNGKMVPGTPAVTS